MTNDIGRETRYDSLELAVKHYGYANQSASAIPANAETVLYTAETFAKYIDAGQMPHRGR